MSLLETLPMELEKIIIGYKNELEEYEKLKNHQIETIKSLFCPYIAHRLDEMRSLKVNIIFEDLKKVLLEENIINIKYQLPIYGSGHSNNNKFWDFNILKDDHSLINDLVIEEIVYSYLSNILFIKFEENHLKKIYTDDNTSECEEFDIDIDINDSDIGEVNWEDLI